jgi:hypothetical protein
MGSSTRFLALAGAAWCCIGALAQAEPAPDDATKQRERCLDQHEQAQAIRQSGKLLAARAALRECAAPACPALVSRDCLAWLAEVEQQLPSVIFRGVKDGVDLETLRIREGDLVLSESITGRPLEIDPGAHHFTAELPGFPAQQATYVLHAGEKSRIVRFEFVTPSSAPAPSTAPPAAAPKPAPPAPRERSIPTVTYALGGVALLAASTGAVLGGIALSRRDDVEARCAPLCRDGDVEGVKNLALAADISFALAIVSAAIAGGSYAIQMARPTSASVTTLSLSVQGDDVSLKAGGRF